MARSRFPFFFTCWLAAVDHEDDNRDDLCVNDNGDVGDDEDYDDGRVDRGDDGGDVDDDEDYDDRVDRIYIVRS